MLFIFIFFRSGKCKNVILGNKCETGLRQKTYNVLTGSVLSVWTQVEDVLTRESNMKGTHSRMQVWYWIIFMRFKGAWNSFYLGTELFRDNVPFFVVNFMSFF